MLTPESGVVFFPCKNVMETTAFYTGVLGLNIHMRMNFCVILDTGRGFLGFCQYGDGRPIASGMCISLNLPTAGAVDRAYEELKNRRDVELLHAPQQQPRFPVYSFFLKDPNGYTVELQKILRQGPGLEVAAPGEV